MSSETKTNADVSEPPSYLSVTSKAENHFIPPPSYSESNSSAVVYINNYPGPPLNDGIVEIITNNSQSQLNERNLRKNFQRFLCVSGAVLIILALAVIVLQIVLIISHSAVYYYFGFWSGTLLLSVGIGTFLLKTRHRFDNSTKYFYSSIFQAILISITLSIGLIIILSDPCDESSKADDNVCAHSYKIINGLLLGIIGLALIQSLINVLVAAIVKRRC